MLEKSIQLRSQDEARNLFGDRDRYLKMIRDHFDDARIVAREDRVRISGDDSIVLDAFSTISQLLDLLRERGFIQSVDVENAVLGRDRDEQRSNFASEGRLDPYEPKTEGQRRYVQAIHDNTITFGVGPAGTGKTFLAVAAAVSALVRGHAKRLVLVRPAVEAGEHLGFLPGDAAQKMNPYFRPIFDSLGALMPASRVQQFIKREVIEIAPLAYMRGRTMQNAFVILDEAQNATSKQMLMLLTRLGSGSKIVITGDEQQTDLPYGESSGLSDALYRLGNVRDVAICRLQAADIVRHPLVQRIIDAWETGDARPSSESRRQRALRMEFSESKEAAPVPAGDDRESDSFFPENEL